MKNTFKYFMVLTIISAIISCNNSSNQKETESNIKNYDNLENASWLIGKWQNNSTDGNATEIWEKKNDSTFAGKSYFVTGNDTVSSETISIEQSGNQLFYIPTVKEQNSAQPIKFTLTLSTNKHLVFENPKHDFPQKISYTQITNDSLLAEISGILEGKYNSQKFPLTRVK